MNLIGVLLASTLCFAAPKPAATTAADTETQLQTAVRQSQSRLPGLDPWQKKVFEEEVVQNAPLFVKDYRPGEYGLKIDVDLDSISNFLRIDGPKVYSGTPKAIIVLRAQPGCDHCLEGLAEVRKSTQDRLAIRGFTTAFVSPEALPPISQADSNPSLSTPAVGDAINDLMIAQKASAALVVTWQYSDADVDSVHPDEKKYLIQTHLALKDHGRVSGQLELMESDRFDKSLSRLLSDAWIDLGKNYQASNASTVAKTRTEVRVLVKGLDSFEKIKSAQDQLNTRLKEQGMADPAFEQRKVSRGQVVFALNTSKSKEDVQRILQGLPLEMEFP